MLVKKIFLAFFIILGFLLSLNVPSIASAKDQNIILQNIVPNASGHSISIKTNHDNSPLLYKIIKLSNPHRLVIDFSGTSLVGGSKTINLKNSNINNVKIAQFSSNPSITRVVLEADNEADFKNIALKKFADYILISFGKPVNERKQVSVASNYNPQTHYAKKNVYNSEKVKQKFASDVAKISFPEIKPAIATAPKLQPAVITMKYTEVFTENENLVLSGVGKASVKNHFILSNPTRIVYDLPDSIIASSNAFKTFELDNGDTYKVSQFNPSTVRVVIQTNSPNIYKPTVTNNYRSLIFLQNNNVAYKPTNSVSGVAKPIKIYSPDNLTTVISIKSTKPIYYNIYRDKALGLSLYGLKVSNNSVSSGLTDSKQILGMNILPVTGKNSGSRLVLSLNNSTKYTDKISADRKTLEIVLKDTALPIRSKHLYREVVLDPGHGGDDPGATRAGFCEKDITLSVAKIVESYLMAANVKVVMTRTDDSTLSLKGRTDITNSENPDAFVSIHVNSSASDNAFGTETHYYKDQGKPLADKIQFKLANRINTPSRGVVKSMFYVIHHTEVPAVLVEIGFISNDNERARLLTPKIQNDIARSIADGILEFLNSKSSVSSNFDEVVPDKENTLNEKI